MKLIDYYHKMGLEETIKFMDTMFDVISGELFRSPTIEFRPVRLKADNSTATVEALDKAKVMIAKYNSDDRLAEIIDQVKQELQPVPAAVDGGWIPTRDPDRVVWGCWRRTIPDDGTWVVGKIAFRALTYGTYWMQYRDGDPKPLPPGQPKPDAPKSEVK